MSVNMVAVSETDVDGRAVFGADVYAGIAVVRVITAYDDFASIRTSTCGGPAMASAGPHRSRNAHLLIVVIWNASVADSSPEDPRT